MAARVVVCGSLIWLVITNGAASTSCGTASGSVTGSTPTGAPAPVAATGGTACGMPGHNLPVRPNAFDPRSLAADPLWVSDCTSESIAGATHPSPEGSRGNASGVDPVAPADWCAARLAELRAAATRPGVSAVEAHQWDLILGTRALRASSLALYMEMGEPPMSALPVLASFLRQYVSGAGAGAGADGSYHHDRRPPDSDVEAQRYRSRVAPRVLLPFDACLVPRPLFTCSLQVRLQGAGGGGA